MEERQRGEANLGVEYPPTNVGPENPWFASDEFPFWNLAYIFIGEVSGSRLFFVGRQIVRPLHDNEQLQSKSWKRPKIFRDDMMVNQQLELNPRLSDSLVKSGRIVPNISTWKGLANMTFVTLVSLQMFRC